MAAIEFFEKMVKLAKEMGTKYHIKKNKKE